jgi:hypothetical protein
MDKPVMMTTSPSLVKIELCSTEFGISQNSPPRINHLAETTMESDTGKGRLGILNANVQGPTLLSWNRAWGVCAQKNQDPPMPSMLYPSNNMVFNV